MFKFDKCAAASVVVVVVVSTCIVYIAGLSEEMQEMANMLHGNCVEETGIDEALIENARNGDFAADDKLKCYMRCLMAQTGCMDDEGIIDVEAMIAMMPDEIRPKIEDTIRTCGTKIGSGPCDNAYLTHKCYYENNKENYMLI